MATLLGTADLSTSLSAECFDSHVAHRDSRTVSTDHRTPIWYDGYETGYSGIDYLNFQSYYHNSTTTPLATIETFEPGQRLWFAIDCLEIDPNATINSVTVKLTAQYIKKNGGDVSTDIIVRFGENVRQDTIFGSDYVYSPGSNTTINQTMTEHTFSITVNETLANISRSTNGYGLYFCIEYRDPFDELEGSGIALSELNIAKLTASINYTGKTLNKTHIKTVPLNMSASHNGTGLGMRSKDWDWPTHLPTEAHRVRNIFTRLNLLNVNTTDTTGGGSSPSLIYRGTQTNNQQIIYQRDTYVADQSTDDDIATIETQSYKSGYNGDNTIYRPKNYSGTTYVSEIFNQFTKWDEHALTLENGHPIYNRYPSAIPHQSVEDVGAVEYNWGPESMWQDFDTDVTAEDLRTSTYTIKQQTLYYGNNNSYNDVSEWPATLNGSRATYSPRAILNRFFNPNADTTVPDQTLPITERGMLSIGNNITAGFFSQGIAYIEPRLGAANLTINTNFTSSFNLAITASSDISTAIDVSTLGGFILLGSLDFGTYIADDYTETDYFSEDDTGAISDFSIGTAGLVFAAEAELDSAFGTSLTAELSMEGGAESAFDITVTALANVSMTAISNISSAIDFDLTQTLIGRLYTPDPEGLGVEFTSFGTVSAQTIGVPTTAQSLDTSTQTRTITIPLEGEDRRHERTLYIEQQTRNIHIPLQGEDRKHERTLYIGEQTRTIPTEALEQA